MNDKEKKSSIKWLEKLKNIKHIEIYVAIIFIVVILLIFLSSNKTKENSESNTKDMSVSAYIDRVESDLEETLSSIAGVSDVKVMITLNLNKMEIVDSKINITTFPEIKGVLVTAKGVNIIENKMKVLHAIQAVIDITNGNIEILSSE